MTIKFYSPRDPYGEFSNFSAHPVFVYGRLWKTSEHPFQAMKFYPDRPDLVDAVHQAVTPTEATLIGRNRSNPVRSDWEQTPISCSVPIVFNYDDGVLRDIAPEPLFSRFKDLIMFEIVLAKFEQNAALRQVLLGTGSQPIIEDAIHDPYWGWGCSRNGQNKLGRILMAVRTLM